MQPKVRPDADPQKLYEALLDVTSTLVGAVSSYYKHARRHPGIGPKAELDPFFSPRMVDMRRALERGYTAIREFGVPPEAAAPEANSGIQVAVLRSPRDLFLDNLPAHFPEHADDTVQTRSEETGVRQHGSLAAAIALAREDKTVWKISYRTEEGWRRFLLDDRPPQDSTEEQNTQQNGA